jgi:hypothetical protein
MHKHVQYHFLEVAGQYRYVWQDVIKALQQNPNKGGAQIMAQIRSTKPQVF